MTIKVRTIINLFLFPLLISLLEGLALFEFWGVLALCVFLIGILTYIRVRANKWGHSIVESEVEDNIILYLWYLIFLFYFIRLIYILVAGGIDMYILSRDMLLIIASLWFIYKTITYLKITPKGIIYANNFFKWDQIKGYKFEGEIFKILKERSILEDKVAEFVIDKRKKREMTEVLEEYIMVNKNF